MGIDPMNNISNNNKNTLCSYIISTDTRQKDGHYLPEVEQPPQEAGK
jgi:hypothetical protein